MLKTENIIGSLPLVADALGRKYGVKVHIGGQRAYTDGKDIHLPALPLDADTNILNLARGYLDHESAHLRITDFEALKKANLTGIEKHVWNIIEDFMVEERLAEIYPGCKQNFNWLIEHIFLNTNDDREEENASLIFSWLLIHLRSLSVSALAAKANQLAIRLETAYPDLLARLTPLVLKIPSDCNDTSTCIAMAKRIVQQIREYDETRQAETVQQNGSSKSTGGTDQEERQGAETTPGNNPDIQSNAEASNEEIAVSEQQTKKGPERSDSEHNSSSSPKTSDADRSEDEEGATSDSTVAHGESNEENQDLNKYKSLQEILADPSCLKNQDIGSLAGEILETANREGSYRQLIVATRQDVAADDLSLQEIAGIRNQTNALRTRLTGMLQAAVTCRNHIGRSGSIDSRRMAKLAINDPRIFQRHSKKSGTNTAVHILLDASGSMDGKKMKLASSACYAVAAALWSIPGVGVSVTSFPAGELEDADSIQNRWATVGTVLTHKSRMHKKFAVRSNGSTPMAEALWWVLQQMQQLSEDRKIILILSDGSPDTVPETIQAIQAHQSHGHEIYGIGIMTGAMTRLLPDKYCRSIYDLKELPAAMFEMLRTTLMQGKGV